ncbi:hypothetical protein [Neolewinella agarilytica]|uniref:Uncharacterized protein n=1 Tax=Neolewinella agarilytica TaxID=478744 RepID=A0A1H9CUF8_9BACT|nr:hypothetical protein [Neolewinella agarilytica]SEQ04856.1 hypothetical protein SAMN05444359_10522 [Neolewinella agarilytica]
MSEIESFYEQGLLSLEELIRWYKLSDMTRNEATTRLHLIDVILKEVLNWEPENIIAEESHNGEYADYVLKSTRRLAILEAKKEGLSFELPVKHNRLIYSLKSLCRDHKDLKIALDQVRGYCQERGVEIGIVSNGWQFVGFIANRTDGTPPLEGNAIVFDSFDRIKNHYKEFWNSFSYSGISEKYLKYSLLGKSIENLPPKKSSRIPVYPGIKGRNNFQTEMQLLSELVLEDVLNESEIEEIFLKECYAKSGALSKYASLSKDILTSRYKYLYEDNESSFVIDEAANRKGISSDLKEMFANSLTKRPIMLIGDVGVGKSTFIDNLMKVEAKEVINKSIALKINLGSSAILKVDLGEAILDEIYNILLSNYDIDINSDGFVRGAYHSELKRFKNGPIKRLFEIDEKAALLKEYDFLTSKVNDRPQHYLVAFNHITKARKKQVVIFLDNCDQRSYETQQQAFLISEELANSWPVLVFLALRPETFHLSLKKGALSGYHPKAFTIAPPRVDDVILKRLEFARNITQGRLELKSAQVTTSFHKLDQLIEVLLYSLRINPDLFEFIDNISNGNVRIAIGYVKLFLGSGHVNTEKILNIKEKDGSYLIPLHEFQRAVIFGDNSYYNSSNTTITNVFDIISNDKKEHFISPILLAIVKNQSTNKKSNGFITVEKIYNELQGLGFTVGQIDHVISYNLSRKLIESTRRGDVFSEDNMPSMIRVTSLGAYHIDKLIEQFTYLDAIIIDTPIFNSDNRKIIKTSSDIRARVNNVSFFQKYLDEIWLEHDLGNHLDWETISSNISANTERVSRIIR